ncbi:MAG: pyruvate kinase [Clostridiales Family XIII bacterium]|jgi:pyruvate kinase|nr:pyruvate kinase [Clostridiales Family XIII bacterium]
MAERRTKLICTIGPASEDRETLKEIMLSGMDAARLNFSHGDHEGHREKIALIKELREELGLNIAIILDTKGPEIRTGSFENGGVELAQGQKFTIYSNGDVMGNAEGCGTSYSHIVGDVKPGDRVLIDDGLIELQVDETLEDRVVCTVHNGGAVKDHKSINLPGVSVKLPAMSERDKDDIEFGINEGVDFVAASFIRKASDVKDIRRYLDALGGNRIKIISKIENKEGVDNIDEIIRASDGVMVARGDLGVEIPAEAVPLIQKEIIRKCNREGVFVTTATQMMDSMIRNPRPTRAEVADVANAVLDGTDSVMLSGETASGKYPVEAARMMVHVSMAAEKALRHYNKDRRGATDDSVTNAIGFNVCNCADSLGAKLIVTPTSSGRTAATISKYRPKTPIVAFSMDDTVVRQLSLAWGVEATHVERMEDQSEFFRVAVRHCMESNDLEEGDLIVITAGVPFGKAGGTNMLRVHQIGQEF